MHEGPCSPSDLPGSPKSATEHGRVSQRIPNVRHLVKLDSLRQSAAACGIHRPGGSDGAAKPALVPGRGSPWPRPASPGQWIAAGEHGKASASSARTGIIRLVATVSRALPEISRSDSLRQRHVAAAPRLTRLPAEVVLSASVARRYNAVSDRSLRSHGRRGQTETHCGSGSLASGSVLQPSHVLAMSRL